MSSKKEWIKGIRTIAEIIMLAVFSFWVYDVLSRTPELKPVDKSGWTQRDGFIALSYSGLDRSETERRMARSQLREHMKVLLEAGYEVITDEDIANFYKYGAPLPDKALFLMFEGGRKDGAIFGHEVLEEFGIRATMFIQTARLKGWNRFFIRENEVASLSENPYWSIGSQGYELRHINHMPDEGYTFFLTDVLRDIDKIPVETPAEFRERISDDYSLSFEPLHVLLKEDPKLYIFMPANMLWRSVDGLVQSTNVEQMARYYDAAFAREGPCYNSASDSRYNLTRMQVQPDWTINRLLMEIELWSSQRNEYVQGDDVAAFWSVATGALIAEENRLVLTSMKDQEAFCWLKGANNWENMSLSFTIPDTVRGVQSVFLRYTSSMSFLRISVARNLVTIHERVPDKGLYLLYSGYINEPYPWKFDILMRGNRMAVKANDQPLFREPLPVSNTLRRGSVGLGIIGENAPLDGYFDNLAIQAFPMQWARLSELYNGDEKNFGAVGNDRNAVLTIPLSEDVEWAGHVTRAIYYGASIGEDIYAEMPEGELDISLLSRQWLPMPPAMLNNLWKGVIFTPNLDGEDSLERVNEAITAAKDRGLVTSLRLDEQEMRLLVSSDVILSADKFLLPPISGMPQLLVRRFGNRYNLNNILSPKEPEAVGVEVYRAEK